jgi:hypothetical protein
MAKTVLVVFLLSVFVGYPGRALYSFLLSPYSSAETVIADFSLLKCTFLVTLF